jgi:hypothetical protein
VPLEIRHEKEFSAKLADTGEQNHDINNKQRLRLPALANLHIAIVALVAVTSAEFGLLELLLHAECVVLDTADS